jgi:protein-tyrosine phosphatase
MKLVDSRFGTLRGAVRLALSYGEVAVGQAGIMQPDSASVRRLVFVCHGNICRSAFADVVARRAGMCVASFGLSTDAGKAAHPPAIAAAAELGIDLSGHRTTRGGDFVVEPGDLLLAMETRQLRRLGDDPKFGGVPRSLLGLYASPAIPHLHDPYELDQAYMLTCLKRIENAVTHLRPAFPGAIIS